MSPASMAAVHKAAFTRSRPWSTREFADLLAGKGCFAVGDARAFALARIVADEAELLTIATRPEHRRQGLARALMANLHEIAAGQGAIRCFLDVAADNRAAIALYRSLGYDVTGRRAQYYRRADGTHTDAIAMTVRLPWRQPENS